MAKKNKRPEIPFSSHKRVKTVAKRDGQGNLPNFYSTIINLGLAQYEANKKFFS